MATEPDRSAEEIRGAFLAEERQVRIQNFRIACILAAITMPAGASLDWVVNRGQLADFFILRLICSALLFFIWWFVKTPLGARHYRILGLILPALPTLFIGLMIYQTTGADSTYYAGLNLVLLGAALILRWSLIDSVIVVLETISIYLAVCFFHSLKQTGDTAHFIPVFNNLYFLLITGVFVVIGGYYYNRLRFREFATRYELDQNKQLLEESHRKLTELDQAKSRFFANISHELRTPLTLLLAPLETLQQRFAAIFDVETRNLVGTMIANGMRLLKLINDLLDLVRLESGKMEVRRDSVDMGSFLRGLTSAARQVAEDKRIRLEAHVSEGMSKVFTDRDKLEKVLLNLQFNALKFTPAGGRVDLRAERHDDKLVITVEDTGMGISQQNLPYVFDRFWQADDSSKRKYQGVGIGLSLVKELVEVQGGTVSVQSEVGSGTQFTLTLPFVEATEPTAEAAAEAAKNEVALPLGTGGTVSSQEWLSNLYRRAELFPAMTSLQETIRPMEISPRGGRPKVLIADDEPDMLRFLGSQLSAHYQVLEAVDGQQAVDKASQFLPDIVLLDMMMPEKDGLQACRELREHTPTQTIPIILLTARADEETKLAALSAGASDFLAKPFSTTELHVRIKNLIESNELQRKLAKQNQVLEQTIEQLKDTETQLVQNEKLASLGRLSAGIIHEINNPLNFATTGLFTLRRKGNLMAEAERAEYAETLKDVEEALGRVKTIVSDLRSFSHHENDMMEEVSVAEIVESSLRFLSHEWKNRVEIERNLAEGQVIWANKNKLIQVLVNLLHNSVDALKGKTFPAGEQPTIRITGRIEADRSIISVWDNGSGIDPSNLNKIFDPFYTTKDVGEGMGLGLSICYRIVQGYEGTILVDSVQDRFAQFSLEFPVRAETPALQAAN